MTRTNNRALANTPNNYVSVLDFGAVGDGVTDDTAAIQAALAATAGQTLLIPPRTYLVSSSFIVPEGTTVSAYGATLQMDTTTDPYSMWYPGSNTKTLGLSIVGYIQSGTNYADVVPQWSFGYRIQGVDNVLLRDCNVDNIPFDGIFVSQTCNDISIINCTGGMNQECYRNTVAIAPSSSPNLLSNIRMEGGVYNKATDRPAIDVEPDTGGTNYLVSLSNLRVLGEIDVIVRNYSVKLTGITFDGPRAKLQSSFSSIEMNSCIWINGAEFGYNGYWRDAIRNPWDNTDPGTVKVSNLSFADSSNLIGPNLLQGSYNSVDGWSVYAAGDGTRTTTLNYPLGGNKSAFVDTTASALTYSYLVTDIEPDTYYSIGCLIAPLTVDSQTFGSVTFEIRDGDANVLLQNHVTNRGELQTTNIIKTPANAAQILVRWGSQSSAQDVKVAVTNFFVRKGITSEYVPSTQERYGPLASAVPTVGTWVVGETLTNSAPSTGNPLGWVCTTSGTPGTWSGFGEVL